MMGQTLPYQLDSADEIMATKCLLQSPGPILMSVEVSESKLHVVLGAQLQ